jgi:hypothetical protein
LAPGLYQDDNGYWWPDPHNPPNTEAKEKALRENHARHRELEFSILVRPPSRAVFGLENRRTLLDAPNNFYAYEQTQGMLEAGCTANGIPASVFGDTGAFNFVDYQWIQNHNIPMEKLPNGFKVRLADGTFGKETIDFSAQLTVKMGNHESTDWYLVSKLHKHPITLGLQWFRRHIPELQAIWDSFTNVDTVPNAGGVISKIPDEFAEFADVFDLDYDKNPPRPTHGHVFRLKTRNDEVPPPATAYPIGPKDKEVENRVIQDHLKNGRITPATNTTTAAPSFFVNKACETCHQLRCTCGEYKHERRWVIDYRLMNELTAQDAWPLPHIKQLQQDMTGHKYYIKFDIDAAFFLVPVAEEDQWKTTFMTSQGPYMWKVMPMGAKNAPATFQKMIDSVLLPVRNFCKAYMDDGIVGANTIPELVERFKQVLSLLRNAGLRLKLRKCDFFVQEVVYLGHIFSREGCKSDPAKTQAIKDYPDPRTKTDVRGFIGLCNFYRDYYPGYSHEVAPLIDCTLNTFPSQFDKLPPLAETSFKAIKAYWSNPENLGVYDPALPTFLHVDCSGEAWFGDITQQGKPLAFGSGRLSPAERKWPTTDRELFACVMMHRKFGYLLQGEVIWYTDHAALTALRSTLANSPRRTHWSEELNGYPFIIRHKPGKEMHVDGPTRHSSYPKDNGYGGNDPVIDSVKFVPTRQGGRYAKYGSPNSILEEFKKRTNEIFAKPTEPVSNKRLLPTPHQAANTLDLWIVPDNGYHVYIC